MRREVGRIPSSNILYSLENSINTNFIFIFNRKMSKDTLEPIWKVYFSRAPFCTMTKVHIGDFENRGQALDKVIELFEKNYVSSNANSYILQTNIFRNIYLMEVVHSRKEEQGHFSKMVLDVVAKYYMSTVDS